jgi:hypothetical protein
MDGRARGAAVRYCDTAAAAEAIVAAARTGSSDDAEKNRALIDEAFRFADYAAFLSQETQRASASREQLHKACERIQASGAFDALFHEGPAGTHFDSTRALRNYVARASKGLRKYNPRPGFSDGFYRSRHHLQEGEVPLEHALRADAQGRAPATHRCVTLDTRSSPTSSPGKIALHLHLHYAELAPEFVERLRRLEQPVDVFVTTTSSRKRVEIEYHFLGYEHGRVTVLEVENRGRDIGPFLTHLSEPLGRGGYDVIGHLHGKRSLAVDEAMGDRWRTYLLDTLLGPFFSELVHLFVEDPRLGLVFAEDRHAIGWDGNQELARELAGKLTPPVRIPAFPPPFPLGTMFWARPAAVEPLWRMGMRVEDLPGEPVEYDGTMLHAIERTLPLICEATGLSWCTVYNRSCSW